MTKAELIERIARSRDLPADITKKDIGLILSLAFDEIGSYFAKAKVTRATSPRFTFPRFGTFTKKRRSARMGVNPRTLEPMQIEASDTIDFKACRELRESMNSSNAANGASTPKRTAKTSTKRKAKARTRKVTKTTQSTLGRNGRRLTPRDEDAELDALIPNESVYDDVDDELPRSPLKRVRAVGQRRKSGTKS